MKIKGVDQESNGKYNNNNNVNLITIATLRIVKNNEQVK